MRFLHLRLLNITRSQLHLLSLRNQAFSILLGGARGTRGPRFGGLGLFGVWYTSLRTRAETQSPKASRGSLLKYFAIKRNTTRSKNLMSLMSLYSSPDSIYTYSLSLSQSRTRAHTRYLYTMRGAPSLPRRLESSYGVLSEGGTSLQGL